MTKDSYDKTVDIALKHVEELAEKAHNLAYAIQMLLEGGDPDDAAALLQKYNYTDEDGFWIGEE